MRVGVTLAAIALTACGGATTVSRVVDGRTVEGRFVPAEAYEATLRGSVATAEGRYADAVDAYERATSFDDEDALSWLHLAEARCRIHVHDPRIAEATARARRIDAELADTFSAARCEIAGAAEKGRIAQLAGAWEKAIVARDAASELFAVEQLCRMSCGSHPAVVARIADLARDGSLASARRSAAAVTDGARDCGASTRDPLVASLAVDEALVRGDAAMAERRALASQMPLAVLAARAIALGRQDVARAIIDALSAANPDDFDVRLLSVTIGGSLSSRAKVDFAKAAPEVWVVFLSALEGVGAKFPQPWPHVAGLVAGDAVMERLARRLEQCGLLAAK